jgi:hypothetical protein
VWLLQLLLLLLAPLQLPLLLLPPCWQLALMPHARLLHLVQLLLVWPLALHGMAQAL